MNSFFPPPVFITTVSTPPAAITRNVKLTLVGREARARNVALFIVDLGLGLREFVETQARHPLQRKVVGGGGTEGVAHADGVEVVRCFGGGGEVGEAADGFGLGGDGGRQGCAGAEEDEGACELHCL